MSEIRHIKTPLDKKTIGLLKAGERVLLSGIIYTARDQAHKRLSEMIIKRKKLPVDFKGQVIYYCGPTPAAKNRVIGSCGPTTSRRMDSFTPKVFETGVRGLIGKGSRSSAAVDAIKHFKGVYFLAPAGAGAYLSEKVKACKVVGFKDLGPEAIYKLTVKDFPLIVGIDSKGRDIYSGFTTRKKGST